MLLRCEFFISIKINIAKITMDGLKELLIPDDKQVDHLEIIKFKANYLEEHISISISRNQLNERDNVFFKALNLGWARVDKLELSKENH